MGHFGKVSVWAGACYIERLQIGRLGRLMSCQIHVIVAKDILSWCIVGPSKCAFLPLTAGGHLVSPIRLN